MIAWNYSVIPKKKEKTLQDVPSEMLVEMSIKLFSLMNLTWGYVETVCDLCIQMRIYETKPLVRAIRNLKREYDRFRSNVLWDKEVKCETNRGEWLEDAFIADFDRLFNGLENETSRFDLKREHKTLVVAVQQCLTLIDAVKIYARWCDTRIKEYGVWVCDCCMVQKEFLALPPLIEQFAGDCYDKYSQTREMTAKILVNRLHGLEAGSNDEKIWMKIKEKS